MNSIEDRGLAREIALSQADALIKECGDQPSACELSIIEANAAMVVHIDEQVKRAKESTGDPLQTGLGPQLKRENQARMIAEDALEQVKQERDKIQQDYLTLLNEYKYVQAELQSLKESTMDVDLNALREELNKLREQSERYRIGWNAETVKLELLRDELNKEHKAYLTQRDLHEAVSNDLHKLKVNCQKLVDEWNDRTDKGLWQAAEDLESVLKGGAR